MNELRKVIAIDFDGCICTNAYPEIGAPNWDVIMRAAEAQSNGAALILWTSRTGDDLTAAIEACAEWGLELDAVNDSLPEWKALYDNDPRKIGATEYWDDRAVPVVNGYLQPVVDLRGKDMLKIVSVKHVPNGAQYLFAVPGQHSVKCGDRVLVKNKRGEVDGIAMCDDFLVTPGTLHALAMQYGAKLPLAPVIGVYNLDKWPEDGEVVAVHA